MIDEAADASLDDDDDVTTTTPEGMSTTKKYSRRKSSSSTPVTTTTTTMTKNGDGGKRTLAIDVLKDDDDDDDDLVVLTPVTTTTTMNGRNGGARQRYERTSGETKVFDDFTMNFISNESLETSSAAVDGGTSATNQAGGATNGGGRDLLTNRKAREARGFERRSDRAFVNAVRKVMTVSEPERLPQRGTYERLLRVCGRRRGGRSTRRDAENARRALEILKMCEERAPAVRLESSSSRRGDDGRSRSRKSSSTVVVESGGGDVDAPPYRVVLNAKSWTPLDNADKAAAQTTTIRSPGLGRSAKEKDWVHFNDLLVRSLYGSRPEDGQGARSTRRRMTRDDAGGEKDNDDSENVNDDSYEDDSDDDLLDEDAILEEDGDRVDPAYEFVGPKLLFLHVCSALVKDARLRLRAYESWRKKGSDTNEEDDEATKAAAILATNALIYRLIVDIAPSEGDRSQFFARMVEASSLAGERVALRLRDGAASSTPPSSQEYYDASSAKTTVGGKRQSSGDTSYSIANAPTISGAEDCGVFEISSAARDVLEALTALLDVAETVDGASRKHSKIRVQLEDAYAEAWKATGEARLGDAEAKGTFLREIRTPTLRLARAREILARRVDRRHAPGILSGGLGDSNGAGARDVFDYIADDPVRAIKGQQHSDGSSDFALGAAALGAVAASAAYGASSSINPALFTDSLKGCVDAYVAETARSDVTDSTASATASLALALAFASGSSV